MTPFPLEGGRAGDGGVGATSVGEQGDAALQQDVSETHAHPPAHTPIPDPSPLEGEGRPAHNWSWITPALLIAGEVAPAEWPELAAAGVRAAIDLRDEAADDADALRALGIALLHLPTPDHHPPPPAALDAGVAFARAAAGPVLVHCREGVGRSATLALCVLCDRGDAPLDALARAKDARWQVSPSPAQYEAWAAWLRGRGSEPPGFEAFAALAYRHLRPA